jgi:cysteine desulfurase
MMHPRVYLDYAAATPVDPRVEESMKPFWTDVFGNAGGLYEEGRRAKKALDESRGSIAHILGARPEEIIFTSGGTESDNLAVCGVARQIGTGHIITTSFEHHAVLEPMRQLEKDARLSDGQGFEVTYLDVGSDGVVSADAVKAALRPDTILVSIMYANNEIGTIQPIAEIGKIIKNYKLKTKNNKLFFHTDACQAAGYLDLNVERLGVDLMTINASKIYGPKGIGLLYRKMGTALKPLMYGGGQEYRVRSGTENTPLIVGFAKALEITESLKEAETKRLTTLRDYTIKELQRVIPKVVLNGHPAQRLPNNINVSILDIEGEALVLYMDAHGVSFSTGSACTSESLEPSHVILALGKPYEFAHSSMRFTLGRSTTKEDIDYMISILEKMVEKLRKISPIVVDPNATSMGHPEAFAGQGFKAKAKGKGFK